MNALRNILNITNQCADQYNIVYKVQEHMLETQNESQNDPQLDWVHFTR